MKKIVSLLLTAALAVGCLVGCGSSNDNASTSAGTEAGNKDAVVSTDAEYRVAMVTDSGDITDQSFNQATYEAGQKFCSENGLDFTYYKPVASNGSEVQDQDRITSCEQAIDDGYNVILLPGYLFAATIAALAPDYTDVKFIALDMSEYDITSAGLDAIPENVYCAIYQEELAGFMAGYAAVKLGYTKLGFLGGMAVPAVIRYGYGFVQGADQAAGEMGITVDIKYVYGGQFYGSSEISAPMEQWYESGTEIIFACGGGIYSSAAEKAANFGGKIIGVDVDQAATIDGDYGEGMTVTSAMKGLGATVIATLDDVVNNGNWANYGGKVENLGLVSAEDTTLNYVQLPLDTTLWDDEKFSKDDYVALVGQLFDGSIKVDNSCDTEKTPEVKNSTVDYQGTIVNAD